MEGAANVAKDGEKKHRGRFMGKLFKEKKEPTSQDEVDEFLHGPSDKLHMMPATPSPSFPPSLTRIDTGRAPRWPTATEVQTSSRRRSTSPKKRGKGLVVRFSDDQPKIIGEGGDEATETVLEIGMRKRADTHPAAHQWNVSVKDHNDNGMDTFQPGLMRRTQTGFDSIPDARDKEAGSDHGFQPNQRFDESLYPDISAVPDDRLSFADRVKAEMRSGEGRALGQSLRGTDEQSAQTVRFGESNSDLVPRMEELQLNTLKNSQITKVLGITTDVSSTRPYTPTDRQTSGHIHESPASLAQSSPLERTRQQAFLPKSSQNSYHLTDSPATVSASSSLSLGNGSHISNIHSQPVPAHTQLILSTSSGLAIEGGDDALQEFSKRSAPLYTLFRLSMQATKPPAATSLEDITRAALWWFIKGRLNLEATIRDRPSSAEAQQTSLLVRKQAHADLAKSFWLSEIVFTDRPSIPLPGAVDPAPPTEVFEIRQMIISSLRKLCTSMKRNCILPSDSDTPPLIQGLDPSVWVQDDGNRSLLATQRTTSTTYLSEAFPLGDTSRVFFFGRSFAEAFLVEEAASQQYRCPVLLSIVRGHKQHSISVIIVNQNSSLNVTIQSEKSKETTWNDVRWEPKLNTIEINLPRGFLLRLRFSEQDFRVLWGTYDHERRTHSMLNIRDGEELVFESISKSFQYFEQTPQSTFPNEPQQHCHLRIFEKAIIQKAATGPRKMHRGFRIGLNTSPKSKALRGIDQELLPNLPLQFGFLRGDSGAPAFLLKIDDRTKYTIVSTFDDVTDRTRLHSLLTGISQKDDEAIVAEASITALSMTTAEDASVRHLEEFEWQNFRVINVKEDDLQSSKTVLSESLRVIFDFKSGTMTDRINLGPGELKIRLDVTLQNELKMLRQPQEDLTLAISEAQVGKDLPQKLARLLKELAKSESTRVFKFPSAIELHLFQAAVTGFEVLFDGIASSFNISRRRMVLPLYKKWDAAPTRVQVVQKEKVFQLVAFFENFAHGHCMNFVLKSTDVFETSGRSGKYSVRIVDAKFAMPKQKMEGEVASDHEFVCLDMPEYPGEHDDITIVFETEAEQQLFINALPAPTKTASRIGSIRR